MEQKTKPSQEEKIMEPSTSRRSLLKGLAVGAGAGTIGAELLNAGLLNNTLAHAQGTGAALTKGDVAILRFLAAVEIIETDLWQQYNELGGIQDSEVPGGTGSPAYTAALSNLDMDMPQYIHDNTEDEISHFTFLNAFLVNMGADPVDLKRFRTLKAVKRQAHRRTSSGSPTSCSSPWTPVGGRATAAARRTPISITPRSLKPSRR